MLFDVLGYKRMCSACLDEIANLQDPDLFFSLIEAEYHARKPPGSGDQWRNVPFMAALIATK